MFKVVKAYIKYDGLPVLFTATLAGKVHTGVLVDESDECLTFLYKEGEVLANPGQKDAFGAALKSLFSSGPYLVEERAEVSKVESIDTAPSEWLPRWEEKEEEK